MKKIFTAILAVSLSAATILTAEAQRRSSGENRSSRMRGNRSVEMNDTTKKEWANLQKELEKKDPKEFQEVKELAKTNLPAAFHKMQLLIQKTGLKAPRSPFSGMPRRGRAENGEGSGGRREGMMRGGFPGGNFRGGMGMRRVNPGEKRAEAEKKIAEKFPAEYAAYKKAEEENRLKLKDLAAKTGIKLPANAVEMAVITKKYEKELSGLQWQERFAKLNEILEKEGYEISSGTFGSFGRFRNPTRESPRPEAPAKRDFSRNDLARKAKQQFPEEWQEYVRLSREDKKAANAKLEELFKKVK